MTLPLPAVTRMTRSDNRTARPVTSSYEALPCPAGSMRPSSAQACSSGITGRKPSRPVATRGITSATRRGAEAQAIASATLAKRPIVSSVFCVGVSSFSESLRASASFGATHICSSSSAPSWAAVCATGIAAMKKRVSKRLARPSRRQPVAEVDEAVGGQAQSLGGTKLGDRLLAAMERAAPRRETRRVAAVEIDELGAFGAREQQPRFLEALADRGDVVVEAAAREAEPSARGLVVEPGDRRVRERIVLLDDAAGEDPRAAVVVAALGAPGEQHLQARRAVADDDDRRRGPGRPLAAGGGRRGSGKC